MDETIIEKEGTILTVKPEERLDTATAPLLEDKVTPHLDGVSELIIDMEQVEYISSAGLRVFLALYQLMEDRGGKMRVIHVNKHIMKMFNMVNFSEIIPVE